MRGRVAGRLAGQVCVTILAIANSYACNRDSGEAGIKECISLYCSAACIVMTTGVSVVATPSLLLYKRTRLIESIHVL